MAKKSKYSKEALIEKAGQGDNKALALLLINFSMGVFGIENSRTEDKVWVIMDKPLLDSTDNEYNHYLEMFKNRMKDMDEDQLMACYYSFAGTSFNSFFLLEEMASRGIPDAYSEMAEEYKHGSGMQGIFRDKEKAREYYKKAADAGDTFAEINLNDAEMEWMYDEQMEDTSKYSIRATGANESIEALHKDLSVLSVSYAGNVPLADLFKFLVGYGDYPGVFFSTEKKDGEIYIHYSARGEEDAFALGFALGQHYRGITVDWNYLRQQV